MPVRLDIIINFTTQVANRNVATPRSGQFTEGFWINGPPGDYLAAAQLWGTARSFLLPVQASVVGYRVQSYSILGNRLLPGGTSGGQFIYPGQINWSINLPQDALELSVQGAGVPNVSRPTLRCLPDEVTINGEYAPNLAWTTILPLYFGVFPQIAAKIGVPVGFLGRDKTQAAVRIIGFGGGIVNTLGPIPGVNVNQNFVRFLRAYDSSGNPVKGSYLVTAVTNLGNSYFYTLQNPPPQNIIRPSGSIRNDNISFIPYGTWSVGKAVSKKVGKLTSYRGRRSKQRA